MSGRASLWRYLCAGVLAIAASFVVAIQSARADDANYTTVGANTVAVVAATNAFMATLSTGQLGTLQSSCTMTTGNGTLSYQYIVGLVECWSNLPGSRNGLRFADLSTTQLNAALAGANAGLSTRGMTYLSEIRLADDVIAATEANPPWGSGKYFIAIYGVPSTVTPWMLQISGHHIAYNITYNTGSVSATPLFDGVEPPNWTDTAGVAHAPLESQRLAVSNLAQAIQANTTTASLALLSGTFTDVTMGINATTGCDSNFPLTYPSGVVGRGVPYNSMTTPQKTLVKNAIQAWTTLMPKVVSNTLATAYTADLALAQTYVGFGKGDGGTADFTSNPSGLASQHSYIRIDGPRVWIEFVVQQGVAFTSNVHYHTLWRDKLVDYGGSFTSASPATTGLCGASTGGGGGPTTPPTTPPTGPGGPGGPPA